MSCNCAVHKRRGNVAVLSAAFLLPLCAIVALAVDYGSLSVVRSELQRSADAAALAAVGELYDNGKLANSANTSAMLAQSRSACEQFVSLNRSGALALSVQRNDANEPNGGIVVGYIANPGQSKAMEFLDLSRANSVRVRVFRDGLVNNSAPTFFARVLGHSNKNVSAEALAICEAGINGFRVTESTPNAKLLPFTLHENDWNLAFSEGQDEFRRDPRTGEVTAGSDGIKECKMFPLAVQPGNFGSIDIGGSDNSAAVQRRQILNGPNASDMAYYANSTLSIPSNGALALNGNTGVTAGVKSQLQQIKGQARIIPIYSSVSGPGNNAQFTISKFVGVTIVDVKLTGKMRDKYISIQPCFVVDATAVADGEDGVTSAFVRRPPRLID